MKGRIGMLASLAAVSAIGLAAAPTADAATTCDFDPGLGLVNVSMTNDNDTTLVAVGASGDIQVRGGGPVLTCTGGSPTVTNTDTVLVVDNSDNPNTPASGDGNTRVSIIDPGAFGPGKTLEQGNPAWSEIEFILNGNNGNDELLLSGTPGADNWVLGNGGVNWNAGSGDPSPDSETLASTFSHILLDGGDGDNVISAQGGAGTGAAYSRNTFLELSGGAGNDTLEGGDTITQGDQIRSSGGNDTLRGFAGNERLIPGPGDDTVDGGTGADVADYTLAANGATVDLSQAGPQATGEGTDTLAAVENVDGSQAAGKLTGDAGPNVLRGQGGDDTFDGRGGNDDLQGSIGSDTATYAQAPAGVTVDLTAGASSGGDAADTLTQIDNVIGSAFADNLVGSPGPNVLTGLAGNDTIAALAGADKVDVRDGGPDTASCGTEIDTATADQKSVDAVNADCETVDYLPEPTPPPTPTPTPPTTPTGGGTGGGGGATAPRGPNDGELAFTLEGSRAQRVLKQKGVIVNVTCPLETCSVIASATGKLPKGRGRARTGPRSGHCAPRCAPASGSSSASPCWPATSPATASRARAACWSSARRRRRRCVRRARART